MKVFNLGYPRIGKRRELKKILESYWSSACGEDELRRTVDSILASRWKRQAELGVESIPINDFSLYDHVLDTCVLLGAIPKRFQRLELHDPLQLYFAMARGAQGCEPLDMTKWFNTNYHYLVPNLDNEIQFKLNPQKIFYETEQCKKHAFNFHPVLLGPWSYVRLSRLCGISENEVLEKILPLYCELLQELKGRMGFDWVQMDEPCLVEDLKKDDTRVVKQAYKSLSHSRIQICLATYFESPDPWLSELTNFPVQAIHFDLVQGQQTKGWLKTKVFPKDKMLSLGVVSGRNIWAANLSMIVKEISELLEIYPKDKLWLAPSCSLMHLPHDKRMEKKWDTELLSWVSFAEQRIEELCLIKKALLGDRQATLLIEERAQTQRQLITSARIHRSEVKQAVERIDSRMKTRKSVSNKRKDKQRLHLKLPLLPTTTIGSFPQTAEIRKIRSEWRAKKINDAQYELRIRKEIEQVIRLQERLGLDVLVHGECERNDMVEYFGTQLEGFAFSEHGWVQSYGSRCVKPPLLYGDVKRKCPITVNWFNYAQSLTKRPVKGMLTGPVTILNWSFVREDQSRDKTAYQIALALRAEVKDLERAGSKIIQIDEAAIREGLPIKRHQRRAYLHWAIDCFRIVASTVEDGTQIQTHMCYSEFGDMMDSIVKMDADVLLIEFARSGEEFFDNFKKHPYPYAIGPGIYDIHSPRVPTLENMEASIQKLLKLFTPDQLWINPDCGLKTRRFSEIEPALINMVQSAKNVRSKLTGQTTQRAKAKEVVTAL